MMTDACLGGIGGVIAQGEDWRSAKVAAFYSAKLNAAQRNYPVHEQEMLAGVETMLRHCDILQGTHSLYLVDRPQRIDTPFKSEEPVRASGTLDGKNWGI